MNYDPKDMMIKILDIIGYQKDKVSYARQFMDLCFRKAILSAVEDLPQSQRDKMNEDLRGINDVYPAIERIQKAVGKENYFTHLVKDSQDLFLAFIGAISPSLSTDKKNRLGVYLSTLK